MNKVMNFLFLLYTGKDIIPLYLSMPISIYPYLPISRFSLNFSSCFQNISLQQKENYQNVSNVLGSHMC